MKIQLNKISISQFKGLKLLETSFDPNRTIIKAENGVGKTTIFDAFLYVLFGKDSTGRTDFELHPLDTNNQPIKGLVTAVTISLLIDGAEHIFRKEHHEKVIKGQLRGYETLCWIDEVPRKIGEYNEYISDLVTEDVFKLLADLRFFSEKMPWKDRRKILLDISGDVGAPDGFTELLGSLNGRTVDEHKAVLQGQKKRLVQERDEINPRIDEITKGLETYAGTDKKKLEACRENLESELLTIVAKRTELLDKAKGRQKIQDNINALERKKIQRESDLKNDTSAIQTLLDEKVSINKTLAEKRNDIRIIENNIDLQKSNLKGKQNVLNNYTESLDKIRQDALTANATPIDETCYACGQVLPEDKIEKAEENRKAKLAEIIKQGENVKKSVRDCRAEIENIESEIQKMQTELDEAQKQSSGYESESATRIKVIESQIRSNPTIAPDHDKIWHGYCEEIRRLTAQLGKPVSEQLSEIEIAHNSKTKELADVNASLAQADRNKRDHERITELSNREKELAGQIDDFDKQLANIDEFTAAQSNMIEAAVNDKFKYVQFKLFDRLLNEGIQPCCEALFNGVPYPDMSAGQQIFAGVDIVNVLSEHYDISVPLFCDHSESLTSPIESNAQLIELYAQKGTEKLLVEFVSEKSISIPTKQGEKTNVRTRTKKPVGKTHTKK